MVDLMSYIDRGGIIVYILIGLNIFGFSIMLWKLIILTIARFKHEKIVRKSFDFVKNNNDNFDKIALKNSLNLQISKLEYGLGAIKIIASISPLLGLLGTVIGVLNAFDGISKYGLRDPSIFSGGISIALITTVAGLIVAIPHYIGYNYFIALLDNIEIRIEKKVLERL
jgi:biopolymer transport protein ExbB